MIYSDRTLSQKLERTEARANADFVETRARLQPESGATWIDVGGAYAMFDGPQSPLTQTFGLGVFEDATNEQLETLEAFFRERKAPVFHEVSPMADQSILALLNERGYKPVELTSVMFHEIGTDSVPQASRNGDLNTRVISDGEAEIWARTSSAGWATEHEALADFMFNFGKVSAQCNGAFPFIAELDGKPVSTGMLFIYGDVCVLAGASTVPECRRKGAQNALLRDRLNFAAQKGCELAIMGAAPGSQSQMNAQKNGFLIAYTRTKWQLIN
jgi:hypothetical protein